MNQKGYSGTFLFVYVGKDEIHKYRITSSCGPISNCGAPYFWTKRYITIHSKLILFSFKTSQCHQWDTDVVPQSYLLFVYVCKEEIFKYMWYEVSMTAYIGRITNQRKALKWLPFENYKSELLNIWCLHGDYVCICIPSVKFLCLTLWLGEVCTDDNANEDTGWHTSAKHYCIRRFGWWTKWAKNERKWP